VDISSRTLDVHLGSIGLQAQFANTSEGIAQLSALCLQHDVGLVAMEATGGYEQKALHGLSAMGLPVAILNPRAVRQFAQSMGRLEKTDAIDAAIIAHYAEVRQSKPVLAAPECQQQLRARVTRLRQLTALRTAQRNQARLVEDELVRSCFSQLLALVDEQIAELEQQIAEGIAADPLWSQLDPVLRTIKGVADRTVARLFAELPELGTLPNKTVAKLAGLAPLARDSGQFQGKRHVRGGRAPVREILFIVGSVVARYEPDFVAFQERLRKAGKPPKVVRIAVAHKLLTRLNAKARDLRQSQPSAAQQAEAA
jgi:transposase